MIPNCVKKRCDSLKQENEIPNRRRRCIFGEGFQRRGVKTKLYILRKETGDGSQIRYYKQMVTDYLLGAAL